jgi:hypothetical protein
MGNASRIRHKLRKRKEAAASVNYDNAKPSQLPALNAERDKLLEAAMKRLPKSQQARVRKDGGGI